MAPTRLPVSGVAHRAERYTSAPASPASSAPPVAAQPPFEHGQDALSTVKDPKPPVGQSDTTLPTSSHSIPARTTRHVALGVSPVLLRIDEASAKQGIDKMTTRVCGLFNKWPLDAFVRLLGGGSNTQAGDNAPEVNQAVAKAKDVPDLLQEVDMMPGVAPPAYSDSNSQTWTRELDEK